MRKVNIMRYRVEVLTHPSGLFVATSPDMSGFMAHGNSLAELRERIIPAFRALVEAKGQEVLTVRLIDETIAEFEKTALTVETALAA